MMNTVPAQEIKRRGISAIDKNLQQGPVHIIKNNLPQYVVMTEERYQELIDLENETHLVRLQAALIDVDAGRTKRFTNAGDLLAEIEQVSD